MAQLTVNDLAGQAGVSPHTVRYYDRVGLLPKPHRSTSGYRLYEPDLVDRLQFIRGPKRLGLQLRDIAQLLEAMDRGNCPCGHTEALLQGRLAEIETDIAGLVRLRNVLARLIDTHPAATCPGTDPDTWWCWNDFTSRRCSMEPCPVCGCPCGLRPCPCFGNDTTGKQSSVLVTRMSWMSAGHDNDPGLACLRT